MIALRLMDHTRLWIAVFAMMEIALGQPTRSAVSEVVRYEDFGAVGDGEHDDFAALVRAHEHANRERLPVRARDGATYRIGGAALTIPVETDTDFGKARFVIDDTELERINAHVFQVRSLHKPIMIKGVKTLKRMQPRIPVTLPGPCVMIATHHNVKHFIRKGNNANRGSSQTDCFLVDATGAVNAKTPIIWDFEEISTLQALPLDEKILTIKGGKFTTIANRAESQYHYHARGISIQRSNVILDGIVHEVTGEGPTGAPYQGFVTVSSCANILIRDSVFTGRKTYQTIGRSGAVTSMGSYDLSFNRALNVTLHNCRQTHSISDTSRWGIMGSNFCKNLVYDRCELSRFDAHQGVTHATIRDSVIGHGGVQLTGFGTFLIERSTVKSGSFISLRSDYGSTWTGEFIIRDCRFEPPGKRSSPPTLITGLNDGQHHFGYECQMPWRVTIDRMFIQDGDADSRSAGPYLMADVSPRWTKQDYQQPFPYRVSREIHMRGITTSSGKPLRISPNEFLFRDTKVINR